MSRPAQTHKALLSANSLSEICWHLTHICYKLGVINPWKITLFYYCFVFLKTTFLCQKPVFGPK